MNHKKELPRSLWVEDRSQHIGSVNDQNPKGLRALGF